MSSVHLHCISQGFPLVLFLVFGFICGLVIRIFIGMNYVNLIVLLSISLLVFSISSRYSLCGVWFIETVSHIIIVLRLYIGVLMLVVRLNVE